MDLTDWINVILPLIITMIAITLTPNKSLSPGAANTYSVINDTIPKAIKTSVNGVIYALNTSNIRGVFFP